MEPMPDFTALSDDDLRSLIEKLAHEEKELSAHRRRLHGRIEILRAERVARLKLQDVSEVDVGALLDG